MYDCVTLWPCLGYLYISFWSPTPHIKYHKGIKCAFVYFTRSFVNISLHSNKLQNLSCLQFNLLESFENYLIITTKNCQTTIMTYWHRHSQRQSQRQRPETKERYEFYKLSTYAVLKIKAHSDTCICQL